MSRTVDPPDIPSICVWTAPETPTVHKSVLLEFIDGDIADGGGDFTVVSVLPVVVTVLLLVESVTIGSAPNAKDVVIIKRDARSTLFILEFP